MIKTLAAKLPRIALALAILLPVWLLAVMFAAKLDLIPKLLAFGTLTIQTGLYASGVIALVAVIGLVFSLLVKPRKGWAACLIALLVPAFFMLGLNQLRETAGGVPFIYDITTNPADAPAFTAAMMEAREAEDANPLIQFQTPLGEQEKWQDNEDLADTTAAELIASGYPDLDLTTLRIEEPVDKVVEVIEAAMEMRGFDNITSDPATGIVEATDEVFWYGFRDDVVARVRADGEGSAVDFRSTSRVGTSDLGVNAKRIADLRQATLDRLTSRGPIDPKAVVEEAAEAEAEETDSDETASEEAAAE
uniref:DUF1499 domain-containing protein n=1 Tax=Parerythrobacter lutipelagi TaxID=1964208 RepID=UPI001375B7FA|nr:DUF1499 domain-containing protein [Parerythrobacter lutipelagi]